MRRTYLPWLACALTAVIGVPALAYGARADDVVDATVTTHDNYFQDGSGTDPEDNVVEITPGGTVTSRYNEGDGGATHDVAFTGAAPTTCTQVTPPPLPIPSLPNPPVPQYPQGAPWLGTCRFDTPGTYQFYCE